MAETTNISWCDATHNHWIGCTKVSPACDGCYAEHLMDTRLHRVAWGGPGRGAGTRALTSEANRRKPLAWNREAERDGTRPFVFCSSLADVFDNQVPTEWRSDLFDLIRSTPRLVWLLLTKRPQLIVSLAEEAGGLPPNAALGTTVEDQERADRNVPELLAAAEKTAPLFTFLSCEPLLGPIDLRFMQQESQGGGPWWFDALDKNRAGWFASLTEPINEPGDFDYLPRLGLVIAGGETDHGFHKARPTHPDWFRSLRDQCAAACVPFHLKQLGEWAPAPNNARHALDCDFPSSGRLEVLADRSGTPIMQRVGKRAAGRLLDGVIHDARPEVRP